MQDFIIMRFRPLIAALLIIGAVSVRAQDITDSRHLKLSIDAQRPILAISEDIEFEIEAGLFSNDWSGKTRLTKGQLEQYASTESGVYYIDKSASFSGVLGVQRQIAGVFVPSDKKRPAIAWAKSLSSNFIYYSRSSINLNPLSQSSHFVTVEKRATDARADEIAAEHAYYRALVGRTFWFHPGKFVRAEFYSGYDVLYAGELSLPKTRAFVPQKTMSFDILRYLQSALIKKNESATHIYEVRIEDGTVAYMNVGDFGYFTSGLSPTYSPTDKFSALAPDRGPLNSQLLSKSPEAIIDIEKERLRLAAEAERAAQNDRARVMEQDRLATEKIQAKAKAFAAVQKRKGGVRIAMSPAEVHNSSWGRPNDINRTTTAYGVREQWVYGSSYLYFTDGVLTAIQN